MTDGNGMTTEPTDPVSGAANLVALLGVYSPEDDRVQLYKHDGAGWGFARNVELPTDASDLGEWLSSLRDSDGPGRYQIRLVDGRGKYRGSKVFRLLADGSSQSSAEPDAGDRLERLERIVERLAERPAPAPAPAGFDGRALVELMGAMQSSQATMLAPLLAAVVNQKGSSAREMLDVFRAGLDVARESSAPSSDPYAAMIPALFQQLAGAQAAPRGAPQGSPAPTPEAPAVPPYIAALAPYLPSLELAVRSGVAPERVAELVGRAATPELAAALEAHADDLPAELVRAFPALAPHREYLGRVVDVMFPPETDDDDDDGEPGA